MTYLDDIAARLEKATPAPWKINPDWQEDADFITHARTDIEKLLAVARAAIAVNTTRGTWEDKGTDFARLKAALDRLEESRDV